MGSVSTAMLTGDEVEFPRNDSNYHHWDFLGETYSQSTKCRNADDTTDIENHESSSAIGSFSNSNENDAELGSLLTTEDEIDLGSDDFSEKQTLEIVEGAIPIPVPSKKMGNDASFSTLDATPKIGTSSSNPDLSYNGTIVPGTLVESWYNSTESSTGGVVDDEAQMEPRLSSNGRYDIFLIFIPTYFYCFGVSSNETFVFACKYSNRRKVLKDIASVFFNSHY